MIAYNDDNNGSPTTGHCAGAAGTYLVAVRQLDDATTGFVRLNAMYPRVRTTFVICNRKRAAPTNGRAAFCASHWFGMVIERPLSSQRLSRSTIPLSRPVLDRRCQYRAYFRQQPVQSSWIMPQIAKPQVPVARTPDKSASRLVLGQLGYRQ
jgi:hypothetical protein